VGARRPSSRWSAWSQRPGRIWGSRPTFGESLERQVDAGLVTLREGRMALTDRGILLSNEVFEVFV